MNNRCNSSKFQAISNFYKRLYSLVVMTTRLQKKTSRRKEMPPVHFKTITFWEWLHGSGYFSAYELVERLEGCTSDKERIRVVERLVLPFVRNPYAYNRHLVGVVQAVYLGHATHYRES